MSSSKAEALLFLPDWARRLSARAGGVHFSETLQGSFRRDDDGVERPLRLVLHHCAPTARTLLDSGTMETRGEATLDGRTSALDGERQVSWETGRIDLEFVSAGLRFIGGLHNLLWRGEPYRFRIETLDGAPVGDAVLHVARPEAAVEPDRAAAAP